MLHRSVHSAHRPEAGPDKIPPILLNGVLFLIVATLTITSAAVITNRTPTSAPPVSATVAERAFVMRADMAGAVVIHAPDGRLIADLSPEEGGFISGVARVVDFERNKARLPLDAPVLLRRGENGRLSIHDPTTGWSADLMGFGLDNARAFARLLVLD